MKKYILSLLLLSLVLFFAYCNSSKKATALPVKSTYEKDITVLIRTNCTPCHIPPEGRKKAYDNFANVKTDIDEMIRRIELNPGEKGFMPFKKSARLSDSTINAFKKWRDDGLLEN